MSQFWAFSGYLFNLKIALSLSPPRPYASRLAEPISSVRIPLRPFSDRWIIQFRSSSWLGLSIPNLTQDTNGWAVQRRRSPLPCQELRRAAVPHAAFLVVVRLYLLPLRGGRNRLPRCRPVQLSVPRRHRCLLLLCNPPGRLRTRPLVQLLGRPPLLPRDLPGPRLALPRRLLVVPPAALGPSI